MEKKNYMAPVIKVRVIDGEELMQTISQGISGDPATGGGNAKYNQDDIQQESAQPQSSLKSVWDD